MPVEPHTLERRTRQRLGIHHCNTLRTGPSLRMRLACLVLPLHTRPSLEAPRIAPTRQLLCARRRRRSCTALCAPHWRCQPQWKSTIQPPRHCP